MTDNLLNFSAILDSNTPYVVELIGGPMDGKVLDLITFSDHTLTVAETLPAASFILYQIRAVPRLSEVINPQDMATVDDFNPDHGDLVLIPSGGGQFDEYFYSSHSGHAGFFNATTGLPEDPLLHYIQSSYYLRRGTSPFVLVVTGQVKSKNTLLAVTDTFNYVGSAYPTGTLGDTGLEDFLKPGDPTTADIIWLQDPSGQYERYYYSDGTYAWGVGWRLVDAPPGYEDADQKNVWIYSGMIIQRRAATPYDALLTPPYYYSQS